MPDVPTSINESFIVPRFYQGRWWQLATAAASRAPIFLSVIARYAALAIYYGDAPLRRIIQNNLKPVFHDDALAAKLAARRLLVNFSSKLIDLWQFESGARASDFFDHLEGWEQYRAAKDAGRGVLLVTAHLGNWELGGSILGTPQDPLIVLTKAEPDGALTKTRQAARARLGIETIVVGEDPFASVQLMDRLSGGSTIAMLIDRPLPRNDVIVQLFGRPFSISRSPMELARATGCAVVPVFIVKKGNGYDGRLLAPIPYDRPALRNRPEQLDFLQRITDAFAEPIQKHPDQWYHFSPLWK